ncbi:MAG TPA: hypothetical protein VES42_28065 [Pilimelia sp.]|nr:hypothetical protein [Pilimelia sp.]
MLALDALLERLPDALVGDLARKRLRLVGDRLPDALSRRIGLEARLGDDATVDLLLLVASPRELGVLAGADAVIALDPALALQPEWRAAARLARRSLRLIDLRSPLPPPIWLELDAAGDDGTPAAFTAAAPDPAAAIADWDVPGTVEEILRSMTDAAVPAALPARVAHVVASGLDVRQVGCFTGRPLAGVRLFCAATAPAQLPGALARAGWRGAASALADWVDVAARCADTLHLGLDVAAGEVCPGIGLEFALADAAQPHQDPRWGGLLDLLVDRGLCAPAKRDAVLGLGRAYEVRLPHLRRYRQGLHHVKVSVDESGRAAAKVYFGAYEVTGAAP